MNSITGPDLARDIATHVADEAVIPELAKEPMASGKKMLFVSAKQRGFFFAALKRGDISCRIAARARSACRRSTRQARAWTWC
jgi:hypothetical protein